VWPLRLSHWLKVLSTGQMIVSQITVSQPQWRHLAGKLNMAAGGASRRPQASSGCDPRPEPMHGIVLIGVIQVELIDGPMYAWLYCPKYFLKIPSRYVMS